MNADVFSAQPDADALSSFVDAQLGYPKDGIDVGGGFHVSKLQGRTLRHALVGKHPTLSLWAYPVETVPAPVRSQTGSLEAKGTLQPLDPSWGPVALDIPASGAVQVPS